MVNVMRKRLVYACLALIMAMGLGLEVHMHQYLSADVQTLIRQGSLPPYGRIPAPPAHLHTKSSVTLNGYLIPLPKDTGLDANWSGWITEIPPGDQVASVSGSFRIPHGLKPAVRHFSQLALWLGTGGSFRAPYVLLQSTLNLYVNEQVAGLIPVQANLEDCSSNAACLAHLRTSLLPPVSPGAVATIHIQFVPVVGQASWLGFWMNTRLIVRQGGHVADSASGRMYLPPWAADQNSVETIVEARGNPVTGSVTALPNGHWHVGIDWHVTLRRPWPTTAWPAAHLVHVVATGWYPRKNYITHLKTISLHFSATGETGRGIVSYNDEVKP